MSDWAQIKQLVGRATGRDLSRARLTALGGGSVSRTLRLDGAGATYCVKIAPAAADGFAAEAAGLEALRQASRIRVPELVALGRAGEHACLALEFVPMTAGDDLAMTRLGEALAEMHDIIAPTYGWWRDNTIGANPQHNARTGSWLEFWRENRLRVMVDALAVDHPDLAARGDRLLTSLGPLIGDHQPEASLLHGDLWPGNVGFDEAGRPVLFDPAVYYGDRESDLAMAELFGGFSPLFLESYWGAWPMPAEYRLLRRPLYQLYHLLNHVRMFGASYVEQSRRLVDRCLAQV